jgi:hypothetical protein
LDVGRICIPLVIFFSFLFILRRWFCYVIISFSSLVSVRVIMTVCNVFIRRFLSISTSFLPSSPTVGPFTYEHYRRGSRAVISQKGFVLIGGKGRLVYLVMCIGVRLAGFDSAWSLS